MKRKIAVIVIFAMITLLCACGGGRKVSQTEEYIPSNCKKLFDRIILENESGYYYDNWYLECLRYYDKESGVDIPCCSKPECIHDGNEYCVATSNQYNVQTMGMYEGAVYAVMYGVQDDTLEFKLFRIEPDGSARSEVCTFKTLKNVGPAEADYMDNVILHKGRAFVDYSYDYEDSDGTAVGKSYYGKVMIDLSTGKQKEIPLPDGLSQDDIIFIPREMRLDGDWVYTVISTKEHKGYRCDVYRWNFVSGAYEKLDMPQLFSSYTVNDGVVYYTVVDKSNGENNTVQIYRYIPETGVTEEFTERIPEERIIEPYLIGSNNNAPEVTTDRDYIYYLNYDRHGIIRNDRDSRYYVQPEGIIFSFEGEELARFTLPIAPTSDFDGYHINIVNGRVYYYGNRGTVYGCLVEDILAGKEEWKEVYTPVIGDKL